MHCIAALHTYILAKQTGSNKCPVPIPTRAVYPSLIFLFLVYVEEVGKLFYYATMGGLNLLLSRFFSLILSGVGFEKFGSIDTLHHHYGIFLILNQFPNSTFSFIIILPPNALILFSYQGKPTIPPFSYDTIRGTLRD